MEISVHLGELEPLIEQAVARALEARERPSGYMNVEQAASFLATTPAAVRSLVQRREIPVHRRGGRLLFDADELREWVEGE